MDAPLHPCHPCKQLKRLGVFKLRVKDDRYGKKGDPTSKCTECTLQNQISRQKRKRKHDEDEDEEPTDLCINRPALPLDQFTVLSANRASDGSLSCCTRVTTEGMVGDTKEVADILVGHIWEATGYRFTLVDSELQYDLASIADKWFYKYRYKTKNIRKDGSVQLRYECCQSAAAMSENNKPKRPCINPAQTRDVSGMRRYDCHGLLSISPRPSFCDIVLTHDFDHEPSCSAPQSTIRELLSPEEKIHAPGPEELGTDPSFARTQPADEGSALASSNPVSYPYIVQPGTLTLIPNRIFLLPPPPKPQIQAPMGWYAKVIQMVPLSRCN
jgi:hypothetical protein